MDLKSSRCPYLTMAFLRVIKQTYLCTCVVRVWNSTKRRCPTWVCCARACVCSSRGCPRRVQTVLRPISTTTSIPVLNSPGKLPVPENKRSHLPTPQSQN
eukprot:6489137-Amphidinium_carterae.1